MKVTARQVSRGGSVRWASLTVACSSPVRNATASIRKKVVIFTPPAMEPGPPPINMSSNVIAFDGIVIFASLMELNPAVLVVTD